MCGLRIIAARIGQNGFRWRNGGVITSILCKPAPDAWVTAHLVEQMLRETTVEQLILWTADPKLLPKVPFGKYRGEKRAEVPSDYLD